MSIRKIIGIVIALIIVGFLLIQLVPYSRDHDNPPVQSEPNWDSPETRALVQTLASTAIAMKLPGAAGTKA